MPDITLCLRDDCPSRKECLRFMAAPSRYQSYFCPPFPSIRKGKVDCEYFCPVEEEKK